VENLGIAPYYQYNEGEGAGVTAFTPLEISRPLAAASGQASASLPAGPETLDESPENSNRSRRACLRRQGFLQRLVLTQHFSINSRTYS